VLGLFSRLVSPVKIKLPLDLYMLSDKVFNEWRFVKSYSVSPCCSAFKVMNRRGRQFLFCDSLPHAKEDYACLPSQHISSADLYCYLMLIYFFWGAF